MVMGIAGDAGAEGTSLCLDKGGPVAAIVADRPLSPLRDCELRIAYLRRRPPPTCVPRHQWDLFTTDCAKFFDPRAGWRDRAIALGWTAANLVGCHPRPLDYPGSGLLWRVRGGRVLAIHKEWAVVHLSGAERVVHKTPPRHSFVMPWDLR